MKKILFVFCALVFLADSLSAAVIVNGAAANAAARRRRNNASATAVHGRIVGMLEVDGYELPFRVVTRAGECFTCKDETTPLIGYQCPEGQETVVIFGGENALPRWVVCLEPK